MIGHLLHALGAIGNILDLPGSSIRDALALQNPFDQYLTPHTSENRTSGRDLLRHYGIIGHDDNWGNFAGGLAAETALDPLNLIGGGILKNAFKRQNQIKRAHSAIAALDPLKPGFTPEIIHALTGRHVTPMPLDAQQAWQKSLTPAQRSAIAEWTHHSTGPNALERGIENQHSKYVFDEGGSYFSEPVGEKLLETQFRDMLPPQQGRHYDVGNNPPYTRENVMAHINDPLREAIRSASIPHDTEMFRSHMVPANVGDVVHDPGFMATSAQRDLSDKNMNIFYDRSPSPDRHIANIVVPQGSQGATLHGLGGGFSHGEAEVLFHKPHLRVLAKRELPVANVMKEGRPGLEWYRSTGVGSYVPSKRTIDPYADAVLSGAKEGTIKTGVQPNYLMEIVPKGFKAPLSERLNTRRATRGLAGYNAVARSRSQE